MVSKWPFEASVHGLIQQVQLVCSTGRTVYRWSTEFPFSPTRRFKFDVAIHEPLRIGLEYNGLFGKRDERGEQKNLGHQTISGLIRDWDKIRESQLCGWMVLPFSPDEVRSGEVMNVLKRAIEVRTR